MTELSELELENIHRYTKLWPEIQNVVEMVKEEAAELILVLCHIPRGKKTYVDLAGEIADVEFTVEFLKRRLFEKGVVEAERERKAERMRQRVDKAWGERYGTRQTD